MYCTRCGKQKNNADNFCPHCGVAQNQNTTNAPNTETVTKNEVVQLVKQAMRSDDSVWGEIYEKTHRYVYFMALKFLRSEQDAQDITQEVYIQAIRSIGQLYSADSFFGWLRSIVYSKCKDLVKKKKPTLLEDEAQGWLENIPEIDDKFLPDMTLDSAESRRMILELIDALPYLQRQAVMFYYYDEMTIDQIAALMECPAGTVKSRLNYARQQIKNGVKEHERKGIKLYGVATLPILVMLLREQASTLPIPPSLGGSLAPIISNTGSSSPVTTSPVSDIYPSAQPNNLTPSPMPSANIGNAIGSAASTAGTSAVALYTKIIGCILAAALVIGGGLYFWLSSDNEDAASFEPELTYEIDYMQLYAPVIDQYRSVVLQSVAGNFRENNIEWQNVTDAMQQIYNAMYPFPYNSQPLMEMFGFALKDLNGNGMPELLLLSKHFGFTEPDGVGIELSSNFSIHAVYSLVDSRPHLLWHSTSPGNSRGVICHDGVLNTGMAYAGRSELARHSVSHDGSALLLIEGFSQLRFDYVAEQWLDSPRHYLTSPLDGQVVASQEEVETALLNFFNTRNTNADFLFIPLFDNENNQVIPELAIVDWQELYLEIMRTAIAYSEQSDWTNHNWRGEFPLVLTGFNLVDLNADGIPELIIRGGDSWRDRSKRIFTVTPNGVEHIYLSGYLDGSVFGVELSSRIQSYRHLYDGSFALLLREGYTSAEHMRISGGADEGSGAIYWVEASTPLSTGFAQRTRVVAFEWEIDWELGFEHHSYTFNSREVDETEFNRLLSDTLADLTRDYEEVPHTFTTFEHWGNWNTVSDNDLREFLASWVPLL